MERKFQILKFVWSCWEENSAKISAHTFLQKNKPQLMHSRWWWKSTSIGINKFSMKDRFLWYKHIIFRVLATWRWVYQRGTDLGEIMPSFPWILRTLLVPLISYKMKGAAWGQGIGRHKEAEVMEMGMKDLKALSSFLGRIIYLFIKSLC